jgi:5'-methylthioadenosine phosphorylase
MPDIGIIGGSGVYDPALFSESVDISLGTPYGPPSGPYIVGRYEGREVAFLARHGPGHVIPPHKVNFRANLWGLKELGVERVFAVSAVGSLREEYRPGQLVLVDQFIDFTKKRDYTFYNGPQVTHISTAEPYCGELRGWLGEAAGELGLDVHERGRMVVIEGPRFSTKAESMMFQNHADIIGMTGVPEAQLARELELCYATVAMVTDYDVWKDHPVNVEQVVRTMKENVGNVKDLLKAVLGKVPGGRDCPCKDALAGARF